MSIVLFGSDIEESRYSRIVTGIAGETQNKLRNEFETEVSRIGISYFGDCQPRISSMLGSILTTVDRYGPVSYTMK